MPTRLWLVVLAVACNMPHRAAGEDCDFDHECASDYCFLWKCTAGVAGDLCKGDHQCKGLTCYADRCMTKSEAETARQRDAADKETRLLAESGVAIDGGVAIETAVAPPGQGARVRTVQTTAARSAFAACRADERLVGGGCRADRFLTSSYPSGNSKVDTVGARWNCELHDDDDKNRDKEQSVTAYALCEKVP